MTLNIMIGVGGTGAKVVEATIHAAAAGLGPDNLRIGFVDQDESNGNVIRARRLLRTVEDARRAWRSGGHHHIDGGADGRGVGLLATDIRAIASQAELWVPHPGRGMTLSRIFGDMGEDRALFDVLYAKGPLEQDMLLDEGYRGRPSIGSAAISSQVDQDAEFWKGLMQQIRQAQAGQSVRLLLAGSVFGGTGAAGFPTLARLVRRRLEREGIQANVSMGGILMLPYFSFKPPEEAAAAPANVARSEQLLIQSRGALKYYDTLFKHEHVFDELYLVGWNHLFELDYHEAGAGDQENPALAPELFAALGACRYFAPEHEITDEGEQDREAANRVFVCARESDGGLGWGDLPSPGADRDEVYRKLGKMLRFAAAWKHWASILSGKIDRRELQKHGFFSKQGVVDINHVDHPASDDIKELVEYIDALALWAGAIEAYASRNSAFQLWRVGGLMQRAPRFETPQRLLSAKPSLSEAEWPSVFNGILTVKPGYAAPADANTLVRRLYEENLGGDHKGMGRIVAAMHEFSAVS